LLAFIRYYSILEFVGILKIPKIPKHKTGRKSQRKLFTFL